MIKISATQLESYRRFCNDAMSQEQFERSLLRLDPPNAIMERGSAFHEMMQTDTPEAFEGIFSDNCITQARAKMDYRNSIFEHKVRRIYPTAYGDVLLTGMADQLIGREVVEIKTKYSPINYDTYADSMQWRIDCELFKADAVIYKVFQFKDAEAMDFSAYEEFYFPRPIGNARTVEEAVHNLTHYIILRGLEKEPVLEVA